MKKVYRNVINIVGCISGLMLFFTSCSDESGEVVPQNGNAVPSEVIGRLRTLGFNTGDIQMKDGNYLVEGDMMFSHEALEQLADVNEEHYRSINQVTCPGSRTIRIYGNLSGNLSTGLDYAIVNYNALSLCLQFQRVYQTPADITISLNKGSWAYSGYPSGGNPYPNIYIGSQAGANGANYVECLFTHNIGHCIGMAHTDAFGDNNCPSDVSEGTGAVYIPGSPTSDPNSIFNKCACASLSTTGEFSNSDISTLHYIY